MSRRYVGYDQGQRYGSITSLGGQARGHHHAECVHYNGPEQGRGAYSRRCCPVDGERTACGLGRMIPRVSTAVDN